MLNHEELKSFVAVTILGESDRQPLSVDDAFIALSEWVKEGVELPEGITAQALSDEWNRQLSGDAAPENHSPVKHRYIIKYGAKGEESPVLTTYAAELAENGPQAAAQFRAKHPDKQIVRIIPVNDKDNAFLLYGMGSWTDEEKAAYHATLSANYNRSRIEHDEAKKRVSSYTMEEFCLEQEYTTRRAEEETQNADGVHVGDIFYACWGYDQTNYDFYQVVELRGKHTAIVRKNACKAEMCSDYSGYKRPIRDSFCSENEYSLRTSIDEYYKCPTMKVPDLSGKHHMLPVQYGKLYCHSTGA